MGAEVLLAVLVNASHAELVPAARGHVVGAVPFGRRVGGDRQHGVHDQVGRDDVEDGVGQPREVLEHAPAEGEDDRLRHPESLQPARERFPEGALDDRGPDDRERDVAVQLDHGVLGQRLREGVDVGEPHRPGLGPAALHEPVLDPAVPQPLDGPGRRRRARRPHPGAGLAAEPVQHLRAP